MTPNDQIELQQRALVILAMALAFDERLTFREMVAKQDDLIHSAKVQALRDMEILPKIEPDGAR